MFVLKFWLHFWGPGLILNVLEKKFGPHILCIFEMIDGERRAYMNV